ncbi:MAG: hypothetical protein KJO11_08285 [Gemmatimonadetes bacterium]|nr:hypothetical protein [Gemmatimonadota bacterium]MBT8405475.1 hypothetical protein [Gemmatimonadota bacterium]NNF37559.1 hypothetical protein [Gemmatimonadota bacterium]NNK64208.1 hypothetical protein [Gemmatimonadota bacterium]
MSRLSQGLLAAVGVVLAAGPLAAQSAQVGAGVLFQSYSFDDPSAASVESITVMAIPFAGTAWLGERVSLGIAGTWADGRLEDPDRGELSIQGLTDTQVTLTVSGRSGATSVSAVALLPTGVETQTLSESRVAGAVASELLPFAISNWGTGGGVGLSASSAHVVGPLGVGLSASYLVRREYSPLDAEQFAYRPGDVLRLVAAVDGTIATGTKGTLRVSLFRHRDDLADDANLFRAGDRFEVLGSIGFPLGAQSTGLVYGIFHSRDEGTYLSSDGTLSSQDLILAGGGMRSRVGRAILQPRIEARLFRRDDGVEQGYDLGVGLDVELPVGTAVMVPSVRAHIGNLEVRESVETAFTGLEFGLALRFGGAG